MRNLYEASQAGAARRGAAQVPILAVMLAGILLFLAAQNTVLLVVFGTQIEWPSALAGVRVVLNVLRVLVEALLPWALVAAAMFAGGALAAWGALRMVREVRHA